jgi:CDP-diacylglycerol--serine O-phosphatidyltransferase
VARLARTTSDFGAQLDSLCDVVSFGVAPGFLLVKVCPQFTYLHPHAVWIIAAAFAACAALRLARFNVESTDDDEHLYFSGLPSPAAAAVIASFAIMFYTLRQDVNPAPWKATLDHCLQAILPFFGLIAALLMVSRIRYPHIPNRVLRGQRSFGHVVAVLFFFVAIMVVRGYAMPIAASAFVLYGPILLAWEKWVQHRRREEPLF